MLARESSKTPGKNLYLCFVEFDNPHQATACLHQMQGYRVDKAIEGAGVKISFAKSKGDRTQRPAGGGGGGGGGLVCREELAAPLLEALQGVAQLPVRVSELGEAPLHVENKPNTAGLMRPKRLVGRGWPHLVPPRASSGAGETSSVPFWTDLGGPCFRRVVSLCRRRCSTPSAERASPPSAPTLASCCRALLTERGSPPTDSVRFEKK